MKADVVVNEINWPAPCPHPPPARHLLFQGQHPVLILLLLVIFSFRVLLFRLLLLCRLLDFLFLYRGFTQWMGGIGIVVLFLAVFPQLHVAGRQAFFAESTGVEKERLTPRIRQTAQAVLLLYLALTGAAALGYALAGVPLFEAVANALATVPAGGFSPNPQSFAGYPPLAQWLGVAFMFLAGVNFLLQYRLFFRGEVGPLLRDAEFRAYVLVVLAAGLALSGYLYTHHTYDLEASLRHAFFQVISILTGTGFASVDFAQWVVPAQAILVLLMFVGGSAGSAAGGIKLVRWLDRFDILIPFALALGLLGAGMALERFAPGLGTSEAKWTGSFTGGVLRMDLSIWPTRRCRSGSIEFEMFTKTVRSGLKPTSGCRNPEALTDS